MITYLYDGSFEGLLCVSYHYFKQPDELFAITSFDEFIPDAFSITQDIETDTKLAERVMKRLCERLGRANMRLVYHVYLSESIRKEFHIICGIRLALKEGPEALSNVADRSVLFLRELEKKVRREKHRMEAFVRFRKMKDGLYAAVVEPDFNVLPLIAPHFEDRYADQNWLIYDARRHYAIFYDQVGVKLVTTEFDASAIWNSSNWDAEEVLFSDLWKKYFKSTNIEARKNARLHRQHMPVRYWKYLVEKGRY